MQISFDPTNPAERSAVQQLLASYADTAPIHPLLKDVYDALGAQGGTLRTVAASDTGRTPQDPFGYRLAEAKCADLQKHLAAMVENMRTGGNHVAEVGADEALADAATRIRSFKFSVNGLGDSLTELQEFSDYTFKDVRDAAATAGVPSFVLSPTQVEAMDETAGIAPQRAAPPPPVPAPSTAAATASTSAPEAPQDGAALDPSVFGQPAAPASPAPVGDRRGLDRDGLPWDERIHSSGENAKNKDGTWRQRRNLPDGLRAQVEAELRGETSAGTATAGVESSAPVASSGPAPSAPDTAAPAASAIPLPPVPRPPAAPAALPVPSPPATPPNTPPAAAPATASGIAPATDLITLLHKVTKLTEQRMLDIDEVNDMVKARGVDGLMFMAAVPADKLGALVAEIDAAIEEKF